MKQPTIKPRVIKFNEFPPHVAMMDGTWNPSIVAAIKAMNKGTASAPQQQIVLNWLMSEMGRVNDIPYFPGASGDRDTAFALGRQFVARHIQRAIVTSFETLTGKPTSGENPQ